MLCVDIHEHNNESNRFPTPTFYANCADSPIRNKAKNALSLAVPFSLGMAAQKYEKKENTGKFGENL